MCFLEIVFCFLAFIIQELVLYFEEKLIEMKINFFQVVLYVIHIERLVLRNFQRGLGICGRYH